MISYLATVFLIGLAAGNYDLDRTNAGVFFKSRAKIQSSSSFWYHTFALDLPKVPNEWLHLKTADPVMPSQKCARNPGDIACRMPTVSMANLMNKEVVKTLEKMLKRARTLIPKHASPDQRPTSFAPLSFIGSMSETMAGRVTVEEVERVYSHVNELIRRQRLPAQTMVADENNFHSLIRLSNSHFHGLKKIFLDNQDAIKKLREFEINNTDMINQKVRLRINAFSQLNKSNSMIHHIRDIGRAIEKLPQGYLSPLLVSGGAIEESIRGINNKITKITNDRSYGVLSENDFGNRYSFFCRLKKNTLLITLKFQVVSLSRKSHLYEVMVSPVPESKNSKHATKIAGLPDYVIISDDEGGRKYSTLTSGQLSECRGTHSMVCPFNLIYKSVSRENCLASLIRDSFDISKFCDFRYFRDHLEPFIMPLSDNSFLVYDMPMVMLGVAGLTEAVKGCHFCIMTIPCNTNIQNVGMISGRVLSQECTGGETEITRKHIVNMAMVEGFFAENNKLGISASSSFGEQHDIKVPNYNFYEHNYQEFVVSDQKSNLKLQKILQVSKEQGRVFQGIEEPFIKTSDETSWISMRVSIFSIVELIYITLLTVLYIRYIVIMRRLQALTGGKLPVSYGTP